MRRTESHGIPAEALNEKTTTQRGKGGKIMKTFYPLYTQGKLDTQSEAIRKQIAEANAEPLLWALRQCRPGEEKEIGVGDSTVA